MLCFSHGNLVKSDLTTYICKLASFPESSLRPPQDYGDVFRILRDASILPAECAEAMVDMARFRNLLVHLYWQLDHERIYDSLQGRCASLEACASHIARWL